MTPEQHKALEVSRTTTFSEYAKEKGKQVVGGTGRGILERAQVAGRTQVAMKAQTSLDARSDNSMRL